MNIKHLAGNKPWGSSLFIILISLSAMAFGQSNVTDKGAEGQPSGKPVAPKDLDIEREITYNRAVEATIWGVPAVSMAAFRKSLKRDLDSDFGDIIYFSKVMDSKHEFLTANNQTPYVLTVLDLREGPMILEVPSATKKVAFFGSAIDSWEVPIADIGPAGEDAGKGGKYLFLPPEYPATPPKGYIIIQSATFFIHVGLRPIPIGSGTTEDAVAYSKSLKCYPFSKVSKPPANHYVDAYPKIWKTLPVYNENFMRLLAEVVEIEPAQPKDAAFLGMLATLGIKKGMPFSPDASMDSLFASAAGRAAEYMQYEFLNNAFSPFWTGHSWMATKPDKNYDFSFYGDGLLNYSNRASRFAYWATWAPKRLSDPNKLPASYYLKIFRDKEGMLLDGNGLYKLNVPANTPVNDFWSIVVYGLSTSAFIPTQENRVGLSSYDKSKMQLNKDGSVDLYLGKAPPAGMESNWIPSGGKDFWLLMRFYGPQQILFDKKWVMNDIERIK